MPDAAFGADLLPVLWVAAVLLLATASVAACLPRLSFASPGLSTAGSVMALALGGALLMTGTSLTASGGYVHGFVPFAVRYDGLSGAFLLAFGASAAAASLSVSYTHLRAHETRHEHVCRLLFEKK